MIRFHTGTCTCKSKVLHPDFLQQILGNGREVERERLKLNVPKTKQGKAVGKKGGIRKINGGKNVKKDPYCPAGKPLKNPFWSTL